MPASAVRKNWLDGHAIGVSFTCAVHCLALPTLIAYLIAKGDIVRIETLNAYRRNLRDGENRGPIVFCRECRASVRASCPRFETALASLGRAAGFRPLRIIGEIAGTCPACQAEVHESG